ncbi:MAG: hypothetical protein KGH75_11920 [Rhodospirillales bacterium]|nr:hypothetical protein [Rhodospirillales bacterium]
MKRPSVWTDERNKLMQVSTSRAPDFEALLLRLNAMPGVPISSAAAVKTRWYMMLRTGRKRGDWTPERTTLLLELKGQGLRPRDILERVNELDGYPIWSAQAVESKLERLKAHAEPSRKVDSVAIKVSPTAPPVEHKPEGAFCEDDGSGVLLVTYEDAKRWARRAGLLGKYSALNLKRANAVRLCSGLPPFAIRGAL